MSYPELLLSNQLCFLVHRLDLAMAAKYRPVLAPLGLTYGQYLAMLALWEHRELGVGELCELLRLDSGTVSPLLKRLEAAGLVKRERRAEDERSVAVRLTSAGAALEGRAGRCRRRFRAAWRLTRRSTGPCGLPSRLCFPALRRGKRKARAWQALGSPRPIHGRSSFMDLPLNASPKIQASYKKPSRAFGILIPEALASRFRSWNVGWASGRRYA